MTDKPKENPHLPRYIKLKPWYYTRGNNTKETGDSTDYLEHHRQTKDGQNVIDIDNNSEAKIGTGISDTYITIEKSKMNQNYEDKSNGQKCSNCGETGHKKRDCLERPKKQINTSKRKDQSFSSTTGDITSKKTDETKKSSEIKIRDDSKMNYDAKQDRWFGYTGEEYDEALHKWAQGKTKEKTQNSENIIQEYDIDEKIELYKLGLLKEYQVNINKMNDQIRKQRSIGKASVRLREDKALYLNDINNNELKYDPKSRIYKSEEMGTINEKTKMFHRHIVGEGLEMLELNKALREDAKNKGIRDEVSNIEKVNHVLAANPTKYDLKLKKSKEVAVKPQKEEELTAQALKGTGQSQQNKRTLADMYD